MLSYENFKDGVRMANRSITAIKKIAEEQSEVLNTISDDGDDDDDSDDGGDGGRIKNRDAVRDDIMMPMLEFNNNSDVHSASMLHGRRSHQHDEQQRISTAGINSYSSRPSTSINVVSTQEQREAVMIISDNDNKGSTVATADHHDDDHADHDDDHTTLSIYEYLQPTLKKTSVIEQQLSTAKSRNPFYRPNTTASTDPHPNVTDPSQIKELGPPLKSMILNNYECY